MSTPFIIYTPRFEDNSGGIIALHALADCLRRQGVETYLWHADSPLPTSWGITQAWRQLRMPWFLRKHRIPAWARIPLAPREVIPRAIVVYPEITDGNPLGATRVVRWFLNKPGTISGHVQFGPGELYFHYAGVFDDSSINPNPENRLTLVVILDHIYRQWNFGPRRGTCYVLRKGKARVTSRDLLDGPVIDDLDHHEVAEIFNRSQFCVSYDTRTMYSAYAALCGCDSVVVPEEGITREQWAPREAGMYGELGTCGIAYGFDDLPNARRTRPLLQQELQRIQNENLTSVELFRAKCEAFFAA